MKDPRQLSFLDQLIARADQLRRDATGEAPEPQRPSPGTQHPDSNLDESDKRHIAGLMRINHTGEVCAQALYQGQALTAKQTAVKTSMENAAEEEIDHLGWCQQRVEELDSTTSRLNSLFYGMSYTMGALAGALGDRWSLGFVAATEEQVCKHLREHLEQIPESDTRSRAILEQMLIDEGDHATQALEAGGVEFAPPVKAVMTLMSKLMTASTYRF